MSKIFKFKEAKIRVPIFETKEKAKLCVEYIPSNAEIMRSRSHSVLMPGWISKYENLSDSKIMVSDIDDIFVIITEEQLKEHQITCFHVIVNEKIGWILINENISLEYLKNE
jgi:hypothetical protein